MLILFNIFFSDALAQSLHSPSLSSILADKLGQASNFSTSEFIHRGRFNLSQNGRIFANGMMCVKQKQLIINTKKAPVSYKTEQR